MWESNWWSQNDADKEEKINVLLGAGEKLRNASEKDKELEHFKTRAAWQGQGQCKPDGWSTWALLKPRSQGQAKPA